jgi:hypothetical protein
MLIALGILFVVAMPKVFSRGNHGTRLMQPRSRLPHLNFNRSLIFCSASSFVHGS